MKITEYFIGSLSFMGVGVLIGLSVSNLHYKSEIDEISKDLLKLAKHEERYHHAEIDEISKDLLKLAKHEERYHHAAIVTAGFGYMRGYYDALENIKIEDGFDKWSKNDEFLLQVSLENDIQLKIDNQK